MNMNQHFENRSAVPEEELQKYYGKHVAWNLDGTRIVASGDSDGQVYDAARAAGHLPDQFVLSYVPYPNEVLVGGIFVPIEELRE